MTYQSPTKWQDATGFLVLAICLLAVVAFCVWWFGAWVDCETKGGAFVESAMGWYECVQKR